MVCIWLFGALLWVCSLSVKSSLWQWGAWLSFPSIPCVQQECLGLVTELGGAGWAVGAVTDSCWHEISGTCQVS